MCTSGKSRVEELVNYHCKTYLHEDSLFMQVYEEILALSYWIAGFKPHNILEIGFKGSTFHIFSELSTGKKVAIDICDDGRKKIAHYMMYGHEFKLFIENSQTEETRDKVKSFCPEYDLIFIDGDHSYDGVKKDFELYKELLSPRGFIVFHDIDPDHVYKNHYAGEVYRFWQDINEGNKTNIITIKSSGKIRDEDKTQHFGGIGLWQPYINEENNE